MSEGDNKKKKKERKKERETKATIGRSFFFFFDSAARVSLSRVHLLFLQGLELFVPFKKNSIGVRNGMEWLATRCAKHIACLQCFRR